MRRTLLVLATALSAIVLAGCIKSPFVPGPTPARTVAVPASIDATGVTDVSGAFAAFLASIPDGSTISLAPGGRYRMESTLRIRGRHNLTFRGNGATVFATTPGDRVRSHIAIEGGSDIVFDNIRVKGANPNAGKVPEEAYQVDKEAQHGFDILGASRVTLTGVTVTDTYGDFVDISKHGGVWADGVHITRSHFERNGRQGIAITAARNVLIEGNRLRDMRRATFDLEPGRTDGWGADNVTIRNNDIGIGRLNFVAAAGRGPLSNITVEGNRLHGQALQFYVIDKDGGVRRNWRVLNNTSDLEFANPSQAVMQFWKVDGLEVRGNRQPMKSRFVMYGVRAVDSCNLSLNGNDYPNARAQRIIVGGC